MKFSAGHFSILSATEREPLHGHGYRVSASITAVVGDDGRIGDHDLFQRLILEICRSFNEYFLLPGRSPHLTLREEGDQIAAIFAGEAIPFLRSDVLVLPVTNVSTEELARVVNERLLAAIEREAPGLALEAITIRVSNRRGRSGSHTWTR